MEIKALASSSQGNCYLIKEQNSVLVLECGISFSKINLPKSPNVYLLITHEHLDHAQSVKDFLKRGIKTYSTNGTKEAIMTKHPELKVFNYLYQTIKYNETIEIGDFIVMCFKTKHDAKEPCGYYIYNKATKEYLLFATDTYYIYNRFKTINYLMIECNYSIKLLQEAIEKGYLTYTQYSRVLRSHFEFENVKQFIKANNNGLKEIYLLHLSNGNSDSELFKNEIQKITGVPVYVCSERSF